MAKTHTPPEKNTDESETPLVRANVNREVVLGPDFASLYANDIQVQTTPWDVRLIFGQIFNVPTADSPRATVKLVGEVRMSPQLAKRVAAILNDQLANYEKRVGPIPQPVD